MRDVMAAAEAERGELRTLLAGLTDDEWRTPSLCAGWSVRDVAAHVVGYEGLRTRQVLARLPRVGFSLDRLNEAFVRDQDAAGVDGLLERYDRYPRPAGLTASRGGGVGLVDGMIHAQDIRRPLSRPHTIDPERLAYALRFAVTAPPLRGFWNVRGVRVVATDVDVAHGRGPEARGPGEAVLMVLAGRRGVARELSGPGVPRLVDRLG